MEIYVRTYYIRPNEYYIEGGHRNFQKYCDAKKSIDDYLNDFGENQIEIVREKENETSNTPYQLTFIWKDFEGNKEHYERFVIRKEYVY